MNDNKQNLKTLIDFVNEIANQKGNEWFKRELLNSIGGNNHNFSVDSKIVESKISLIEKYLSVDVINIIDYSDFDEPCREQLFRDCLEMCRHEKGTTNHKKDFGEFCRYAHLQAEEMLNYFFNKTSNLDLPSIIAFMKKHSKYDPSVKPQNLNQIPYSMKLPAFKKHTNMEKTIIDFLFFLNNFRNELSHRNSMSNGKEDQILVKFESKGFSKGSIDYLKLNSYDQSILNDGLYIIKKRKQDFKEVYFILEQFKTKILYHIKNYKVPSDNSNNIGSMHPNLQKLKDQLNKK